MKTLVVVITHPEARPILEMNFPWIKLRGGCDVAVVDHEGSTDVADVNSLYYTRLGGAPTATPNHWVDRFLSVVSWCLFSDDLKDYTDFLFTEADSIFVRPMPILVPIGGIAATLSGHRSEGFRSDNFWHCPWYFTRLALEMFLKRSLIMLKLGLNEQGFIDRFLGLYLELYSVPIRNLAGDGTYSRNTINDEHIDEARTAIAGGCWFLHGVKSQSVLDAITRDIS